MASAWTSAFAVVLERKRRGEGRVTLQGPAARKTGSCFVVYKEVLVGWGLEAGTWDDKMTRVWYQKFPDLTICLVFVLINLYCQKVFFILMTILIISSCGIADHTSTFLCYFEKVAVWSAICTLFI